MQIGQAWVVSGASLAISYAVASLTPMNQWVGFWLRDSFYLASVLSDRFLGHQLKRENWCRVYGISPC